MAAKTQKHELQKQLDASEAQAQRSLGDNSALRRHLATTESNLKMAHKLLIDVSDEQVSRSSDEGVPLLLLALSTS